MNTKYNLKINKEALKYLNRIDRSAREKIIKGIENLAVHPPAGDIVPLKSMPGYYRLRVGSYRIIFRVDHNEKILYVRVIAHRANVYKIT